MIYSNVRYNVHHPLRAAALCRLQQCREATGRVRADSKLTFIRKLTNSVSVRSENLSDFQFSVIVWIFAKKTENKTKQCSNNETNVFLSSIVDASTAGHDM